MDEQVNGGFERIGVSGLVIVVELQFAAQRVKHRRGHVENETHGVFAFASGQFGAEDLLVAPFGGHRFD